MIIHRKKGKEEDQGNIPKFHGLVKAKVGSLPQEHWLMVLSVLQGIHVEEKVR
jgi:hypothetical protein